MCVYEKGEEHKITEHHFLLLFHITSSTIELQSYSHSNKNNGIWYNSRIENSCLKYKRKRNRLHKWMQKGEAYMIEIKSCAYLFVCVHSARFFFFSSSSFVLRRFDNSYAANSFPPYAFNNKKPIIKYYIYMFNYIW